MLETTTHVSTYLSTYINLATLPSESTVWLNCMPSQWGECWRYLTFDLLSTPLGRQTDKGIGIKGVGFIYTVLQYLQNCISKNIHNNNNGNNNNGLLS